MVVVLIIAILVAIAIALYASSEAKTKATVCAESCSRINRGYIAYHLSNPWCDDHGFLDGKCPYFKDTLVTYKCPSGGTYTYDPVGHQVVCSIHGPKPATGDTGGGGTAPVDNGSGGTTDPGTGTGGGGSSGGTPETTEKVPGTDIDVVASYWPKQEDFALAWSNVTVAPGGVFKYTDGKYYVVTKTTAVTKGQAASGPGGDVYGWYNTQVITGGSITFSQGQTQVSTAKRGDLCTVDGHTYVWTDGGSWATNPSIDPSKWYKLK